MRRTERKIYKNIQPKKNPNRRKKRKNDKQNVSVKKWVHSQIHLRIQIMTDEVGWEEKISRKKERKKENERERKNDMVWNFSPKHELNILDSNIWKQRKKRLTYVLFVCICNMYTILHGWIGDHLDCKVRRYTWMK